VTFRAIAQRKKGVVRGGAFCDGPWYGYRAEVQRGRGGDGGGARGAREEYTPQFNQDYRYEGEFRRVENCSSNSFPIKHRE